MEIKGKARSPKRYRVALVLNARRFIQPNIHSLTYYLFNKCMQMKLRDCAIRLFGAREGTLVPIWIRGTVSAG